LRAIAVANPSLSPDCVGRVAATFVRRKGVYLGVALHPPLRTAGEQITRTFCGQVRSGPRLQLL
jgi:hypothetical protein